MTSSSNIAAKLAEKEAKDDAPAWSRVVPMAILACFCAVLASPGSAVGPAGAVPRFAAVTSWLSQRDFGGEAEAEARSLVSSYVSRFEGNVLVLGAASYPSILKLPGLGPNAVPVDERPLLMPALASASAAAGAAAPLNLTVTNLTGVGDASVDAVLSLGALCRSNTTASLPELRRVLKTGSPLVIYEPTLALGSTTTRRLQMIASPIHEILTDGCRLDGDIVGELQEANWKKISTTRVQLQQARNWLVASYVVGVFES